VGGAARRTRCILVPVVFAVALVCGPVTGAAGRGAVTVLAGDRQVEPGLDSDRAGTAEAFAVRAGSAGTASRIVVYVDRSSGASSVVAGLYADSGGHPGRLLAQGSARPTAAGWTTVPLGTRPRVSAGAAYWIALLAPTGAGELGFRDRCCGANGVSASETSSQSGLTALPAGWSTGSTYSDGPVSAYAAGGATVAPRPAAQRRSAPSAPRALAENFATETRVSVSWGTPAGRVRGYAVYRNGVRVARSAETTYTFAGLRCGTTYMLAVAAYDAAGRRSRLQTLTATTRACATGVAAASVFVSTTGSDSNPCTASAPCRSFDRAYRVAQPGDTIEVAEGNYGSQTIRADAGRALDAHVVFRPALDAAVILASLSIYASHLTVQDMRIDEWDAWGSDVTLAGIKGKTFVSSASGLRVLGGDYGPYAPPCAPGSPYPELDNPTITSHGSQVPTDVEIRGAVFHDMSSAHCPASHMDCLQVAAAIRLTIDANKFYRCQIQDLIMTGDFGPMQDITIENNWFAPTVDGGESLDWNPRRDCPGAVVRYNTFIDSPVALECSRDHSALYYANIVPRLSAFDCGTKTAVQWNNVADNGTAIPSCGHGSYVAPNGRVGMVDRAAGDYHLTADSVARGRGDPTRYPATDIDGDRRTPPIDAGADQR